MTHLIGKTISRYKILEEIGSGSMGIVYKAEDIELKRFVALKFLPPELVRDKDFRERFINEAQAASALDHSNICIIYEINKTDDGQLFIVMAYYEGETLKEKIKREDLETSEIINIITQVADGLARAHESGIIHRDIKPANIIITKRGEVKIVDFGLAKATGQGKITKTGSPLGTVSYMSPEQAKGQQIDQRTDIWSLGILLYELVTKQVPFKGENAHSILYSILNDEPVLVENSQTKMFKKIFQKTLTKNPDERYQDVNELIFDLHKVTDNIIPDTVEKTKNKNVTILTISSILILAVIFCYLFFNPFEKDLPPWLDKDAQPIRLTSDSGTERGRISPDGNYLVYFSEGGKFKIKDLKTSEERTIAHDSIGTGTLSQPIWSPDGSKIAIISWTLNKPGILILSRVLGTVLREIPTKYEAGFPAWSSDNKTIAFGCNSQLTFLDIETLSERSIPINVRPNTWSPDGKKIASIFVNNTIRFIDVKTGVLSDTLKGVKAVHGAWWRSGLAWSPKGDYLVYTGYSGQNIELFALPLNPKDYSVAGKPIPITDINGDCEPFWPTFTNDGDYLSYGKLEDHADICMMDLRIVNAEISGNPVVIENSRRWDEEPCWLPKGSGVVYVSDKEGQPELYKIDFNSLDEPERLTFSEAREKFPQISPKGDIISFYVDAAIWGISVNGGQEEKIVNLSNISSKFCCGKHVWSPDGYSIYVLVPDEEKVPKFNYKLLKIDIGSNKQEIIKKNMGFDSDIALSPDGKFLAIHGIHTQSEDFQKISIMNLQTNEIIHLVEKKILIPHGSISWTKDSKYILHDIWNLETDEMEIQLLPIDGSSSITVKLDKKNLKGRITIGPIDPYSGEKILISQLIEESDIYMLGSNNK